MGGERGVKGVYGGINNYIIPFVRKILEGWNNSKWLICKDFLVEKGVLFLYSVKMR
jgi:hypothetical protein